MTTRRAMLQALALTGAAVPLAGCERLISRVAEEYGESIPARIDPAAGDAVDPAFHLLSRAGYGPWPGDLDRVRSIGAERWIDEQLAPDAIDDTACDLRARRFETIHLAPGTCYEFKKPVLREELTRHTLLRAVYSRRQLYEVMVGFWSDHLNIAIDKGDCIYLKPSDDREVVRAHALGRFHDLIRASATSPAMLVYLDGKENRKATPTDVPNENYARELLELHTMGVSGGYTQRDVSEVARCLTGWRLREKWRRGTVYFDPSRHDDGVKTVLGHTIVAGGGASDLDRVVDIVCDHSSTARFIAHKLAVRFVADDPPQGIVDRVALVFTRTRGDVRATVRSLLLAPEFSASAGAKIKRPFEFIASALRATGADTHAHEDLTGYLGRMGQGLFEHPTPDGYADEAAPWLGTLLWRWNFAFALSSGRIASARVALGDIARALTVDGTGDDAARLFAYFVGRRPTTLEYQAIERVVTSRAPSETRLAATVALILSSPAFQRH